MCIATLFAAVVLASYEIARTIHSPALVVTYVQELLNRPVSGGETNADRWQGLLFMLAIPLA
jgi:hypothetical protein